MEQPGFFLAKVHFPKVVSVFKGGKVVEGFTIFGDNDASHIRRVRGEAYDAVFKVFQFHNDIFHLRRIIIGFIFSCIFLTLFLVFSGILTLCFFLFGFQFLA